MKRYGSIRLCALLLAVALALASCGGSDSGGGTQGSSITGDTQGVDRGGTTGAVTSRETASEMIAPNGEYSDTRFIDAMVPRNQGAVDIAKVALENAEHPEVQELAENIISTQQAEIEELKSIKQREFGSSEVPTKMSPKEAKTIGVTTDPGELANQQPFDKAFIDAMISYHASAIETAKVAYERTSDPEIRELSQGIMDARVEEIEQMTGWRKEWYPEGER